MFIERPCNRLVRLRVAAPLRGKEEILYTIAIQKCYVTTAAMFIKNYDYNIIILCWRSFTITW